MALNMSGRGLGFALGVDDKATPALNSFLGTLAGSPSRAAPMLGMLGRLGGGMTSLVGNMGQAATAVGGLGASLGPIAIAIGAIVLAFMQFKQIAGEAEAIIRSSIDTFASYETALAEVGTILGGTADEMDAVGESARRMASEFGVDVQTQLKATYQTMSAGFADAAEGAAIMTTANKLAVAGVTDVFQSVDLLTTVLNGYEIAAENSIDASDALFQAVKFGKTTVQQLSQAMGMVVPSAAAAGASIDETAAAMATLTLAGQSTRMSSVAMARALDFLVKLPPQASKKMQDLGVDLDKLNVRSNGLQNVLAELERVFAGNEEELARIGVPIRAFRALMPLATTMSEKFGEVLEGMGNKAGATDEAFERMTNTIEFQRKRWAAFKQTLAIELGQTFAPIMKQVLNVLEAFITAVDKLPGPLKKLLMGTTAVGLSLPVIVDKGLGLIWMLVKLAIVGVLVAGFLATWAVVLVAIGVAIAPLIVLAGALFAAWKINFFGIQETVVMMWEKVKLTFEAIKAFIEGGGIISGPLAKELAKAENTGVLKFARLIFQVWQRIKAVGMAAWEGIKESIDAVLPAIKEVLPNITPIVEALIGGGDASVDLEKKLPIEKFREFGEKVGDVLGFVIRFGVGLATFWQRELKPVAAAIFDVFRELWPAIKVVAQAVGRFVVLMARGLVRIVRGVKKLVDIIGGLRDKVTESSPVFQTWLGGLQIMITPVVMLFKAWLGIMEKIAALGKGFGGILKGAGENIAIPIEGEGGAGTTILEGLVGQPTTAVPPPSGIVGGKGTAGEAPQAGKAAPIQIQLKSTMEVDGDQLGEKVQKFVIDQQSAEMIPEPTA